MFHGRERELGLLNDLYTENGFQLFILYGRRRIGKTTLITEFCKDKDHIFFSAVQNSEKRNLENFSNEVFSHFGENELSPFSDWITALRYINKRQKKMRLVLVIDEFPYLAEGNKTLISELQHLIDHELLNGNLYIVISGSYMSFMEKELLSSKSPLFGRRTGQLKLKGFSYKETAVFSDSFSVEKKLEIYGAVGGTPLYISKIDNKKSFKDNIINLFLKPGSLFYEEPLYLLREEIYQPEIYNAILEAIASGASKSNEIATKVGEPAGKCLKYINTLIQLNIIRRETPFGTKESSRKSIYIISDNLFRFWYRYVFANKMLIDTGAYELLWENVILPDYTVYMGKVFEDICKEYLLIRNTKGTLPFVMTNIGAWWGTDPATKKAEEIDIVGMGGNNYIFGECKWQNKKTGIEVLEKLQKRAELVCSRTQTAYYYIFSKKGFSAELKEKAASDDTLRLISLEDLI